MANEIVMMNFPSRARKVMRGERSTPESEI